MPLDIVYLEREITRNGDFIRKSPLNSIRKKTLKRILSIRKEFYLKPTIGFHTQTRKRYKSLPTRWMLPQKSASILLSFERSHAGF